MIAHLEGKIIHNTDKFFIIDVNGVGYKAFMVPSTLSSYKLGDEISIWTYMAVRENSTDLYGFVSKEEMNFFDLLLNVSGVGPKSALSILGLAPTETLKKAIATGDITYLNKVSGIGKKTAERIIVELRDKLLSYKGEESSSELNEESDILEALKALGYSQSEARDAFNRIPPEIKDTKDKIKEALKFINKKH